MTHYYKDYVKVPTGDRLRKTAQLYEQLGLPGCLGSMDATHVFWNKCPTGLTHLCTGKEGRPTIAFNCIVDYLRYIHHVSTAFFGATNDITITKNDQYTRSIMQGLYTNYEFFVFGDRGKLNRCKGGWILVDGGYPKVSCFVNGMASCYDPDISKLLT